MVWLCNRRQTLEFSEQQNKFLCIIFWHYFYILLSVEAAISTHRRIFRGAADIECPYFWRCLGEDVRNLSFKNDKCLIDRRIWKDFSTTWPHSWDVRIRNVFNDSTQGCNSNHGWRIHDVTVWAPNNCLLQGSNSNLGPRAVDMTGFTVWNGSVRGCRSKYFPLPLDCEQKMDLVLKINLSWTSRHWRGAMSSITTVAPVGSSVGAL